MRVEFAESGYLEVWHGETVISRHRQEREAIESVIKHAADTRGVDYQIRRGVIRVTVTHDAPVPVAAGAINGALTV